MAGGLVGKHPSLSDLTDGDLKYHTDFRRVYATLLDDWLGVASKGVLRRHVRDAAADRHEEEVGRRRARRRATPVDGLAAPVVPPPAAATPVKD